MELFSIPSADGIPCVRPPVIFGVGLNYRTYAEQIGKPIPEYPLIFMKQGFCAVGHKSAIELPTGLPAEEVDYEGELAVIIGKRCKNCSEADALDYVAGYMCANDVSSRDWQFRKGSGQFSRGKTFDTFCPIGPGLISAKQVPDPNNLSLRTFVNGDLRQDGHTSDMIFSIQKLIVFLSGSTTLLPGTVILTGTPGGTGSGQSPQKFLKAGDTVEIEIEGLGRLSNPVVREIV